ncbi:hypothetical protein U1Q18_018139, partial [Sarracenia purpurea var. burkii]
MEESDGWTNVSKGKGKAPEGQKGGHVPELPATSNFELGEGTAQYPREAVVYEEAREETVVQEVVPEQETRDSQEKKDHQTANLSESEEEDLDAVEMSMKIITDDFDRPAVSPKGPPDKKSSSSKKKKK